MKEFSDVTREEIEREYRVISKNVKKYRLIRNMTQEEIALSMGLTTATFYTNAENSKKNKHFNLEHIIRISKALDINICLLFEHH